MTTLSIPSTSREYVEVTVFGPEGVDLPTLDAEIAIIPRSDQLQPSDWNAAEWKPGTVNVARLLIGPGSPFGALVPASYEMWVRVESGAEEPVRLAGFLTIVAS